MKILFWMSSSFDSHITSEHLLLAVLEQLCQDGHSVHVLQKNTSGDLPLIPDCLRKYKITTKGINYEPPQKTNFVARYFSELRYVFDCIKELKKTKYDACFLQSNNVAGVITWLLRKYQHEAIITYNVQDIFPYNLLYSGSLNSGLIFKVMASMQRYAYKSVNHIITVSDDMKDQLIEDGVPENKIVSIFNWSYQDEIYDTTKLDYTRVNDMFDKSLFNVVYAGNIGVMQNVDIVIETARILENEKDIQFHIIGNGVFKEKLKEKAKKLALSNIRFWSMLPPDDAPALYASADVNVIPLIKNGYKTALPSKTATCLAVEKPIVFCFGHNTKFEKIFEGNEGIEFVDSNNAEEMALVLLKLREQKKNYSYSNIYNKYFIKSDNSKKYADVIVSI